MAKTKQISKISSDDWWFENKYKDFGIKSRYNWFVWKTNKEYGETYNLVNHIDKNHISKQKGSGSSDISKNNELSKKERVKFIPQRFDIEQLFKFNYDVLFNYKNNKRFKKIYSIVFCHEFFNTDKDNKYKRFVEIYEQDKLNGNLDKINDICQKLSKYVLDNHLGHDDIYVGGSVICNIALMISNYIKTGTIDTSLDFISKMSETDMNEEYNTYCLFLLCQIFTTKYHYYYQYICGEKTKEWWRINHIRHRYSDKDMKSKGVVPKFTLSNGEINYVLY